LPAFGRKKIIKGGRGKPPFGKACLPVGRGGLEGFIKGGEVVCG